MRITKENAQTKSEISALIFAHKIEDFHSFTSLVEEMLDRYALNFFVQPRPHKCPVCEGRGIVPNGFYLSVSGIATTSSATPELCETCNGAGIVWDNQK